MLGPADAEMVGDGGEVDGAVIGDDADGGTSADEVGAESGAGKDSPSTLDAALDVLDEDHVEAGPRAVRVFTTSGYYPGDFASAGGGASGGDNVCTAVANDAGLGGSWVAWLSDQDANAIDRIPDGQYRLIAEGGPLVVANSKPDLVSGTLGHAIDHDERGVQSDAVLRAVWTGTASNGTRLGANCSNWTVADATATSGYWDYQDYGWTAVGIGNCGTSERLYCFER